MPSSVPESQPKKVIVIEIDKRIACVTFSDNGILFIRQICLIDKQQLHNESQNNDSKLKKPKHDSH